MGVRAVVAAGWAVDDGAAETFAKAFYRAMGSGIAFGESTRLAREETWRNCPGVDTWGAYQCYGDPDYRMVRNQGVGAIVAGQSDYVAPAEAIADLMNLRVDALTLTRAEIAGLREGLSRIQERLDRAEQAAGEDWRSRGDLLEALGLAHGELGFFQEAVELLARAIRSEGKPGTGGAQDQRARFQARWAMALHRAGDTQQALRECQSALDDLQAPGPSGEGWLTRERCRSLTAIHSRRVQMLAPGKREEELERLIKVYDRYAAQWPGLGADPLTPYSRLLWLTAHYLLTAYRKTSLDEDCPDFDSRCTELEQRVLADQHVTRGIWNEAILRELHLLEALRRDTLVDRVPEIIAGLRRAMTRGVSERQFSAIVNNLDLLCTLCAGATVNRAAFRERARTLAELRQTLLEQAGAPSPEDRPRSTG
jgi:tetratricopeptide (TPR) repeat protein